MKKILVAIILLIAITILSFPVLPEAMLFEGESGMKYKVVNSLAKFYDSFSSEEITNVDTRKISFVNEKSIINEKLEKGLVKWEKNEELAKFSFKKKQDKTGKLDFSIKLPKSKYLDRKRRLNFSRIEHLYNVPQYVEQISEFLKFSCPKFEIVSLADNNNELGLYYMYEGYGKAFTEKRRISNGIVFKYKFSKDKSIKKFKTDFEGVADIANERIKMAESGDFSYLDMPYMAKFFVVQNILGQSKMTNYWFYRMTNGKIYPLPNNFEDVEKLNISNFEDSIWYNLLTNKEFVKELKIIYKQLEGFDFNIENSLFSYLITQEDDAISKREHNYFIEKNADLIVKNLSDIKGLISSINTQEKKSEIENIDLLLNSVKVKLSGNKILFEKDNSYKLNRNIIVPRGYKIIFQEGSKLEMGKKVSLLSYSPINFYGTKESPVVISSIGDSTSFGAITVVGDDKMKCEVNYLNISNGSEALYDGVYVSGMLNFYHAHVTMNNCNVSNGKADDGLNIKYGAIEINHCNFFKNYADQVDLDFCAGKVSGCKFDNNNGDSNGDGLDFSGSDIVVENCSFNEFDDKGISVGENTRAIIRNNSFKSNSLGLANKDLSRIIVSGNKFENNKTVFALYQKKEMFGGSKLYLFENEYLENGKLSELDKKSEIIKNPDESIKNIVNLNYEISYLLQ